MLVNVGYRVNNRMDVGAEVFWMPVDTAEGRFAPPISTPWRSSGRGSPRASS